ncbi:MAG: hypothetical protein AAB368_12395, partial [bacterium]
MSPHGKTGAAPTAQVVGTTVTITVAAADAYWNQVSTSISVTLTPSEATAAVLLSPKSLNLTLGTTTFDVLFRKAVPTTSSASATGYSGYTSPALTINPGTGTKLQLLVQSEETEAPGTGSGKTTGAITKTAGLAFDVRVNAVDSWWNVQTASIPTVTLTTNATYYAISAGGVAGLANGTTQFSVTLLQAATASLTVTEPVLTQSQSPVISVNPAAAVKLQTLLPGEFEAPGAGSGKTGAPTNRTAGVTFGVTVNVVDASWNKVLTANPTVQIATYDDAYDTPPSAAPPAGGPITQLMSLVTAAPPTVSVSAIAGGFTGSTSPVVTVDPNAATRAHLILPGETFVPGRYNQPPTTGKTGSPTTRTAGLMFGVTVYAVDDWYNRNTGNASTIQIQTSDPYDTEPSTASFAAGMATFPVTMVRQDTSNLTTITATSTVLVSTISPAFGVNPGPAVKLQILVPGEVVAEGRSPDGKTAAAPSPATAGTAFSVTVRAVDANWNKVNANPTVRINTSDIYDAEPGNQTLVSGEFTFTNAITFVTANTTQT